MRFKVTMACATLLAFAASTTGAAETIGVIKRSTGSVLIERGDTRMPAAPGTELERGDRLVTGEDGYASISMRRAASLSVGANSAVALDRYAAEDNPRVSKAAPRILQSLASFFAVNRQR